MNQSIPTKSAYRQSPRSQTCAGGERHDSSGGECLGNQRLLARSSRTRGTISYDSDATGTNDATALTDDPDVAGSDDATIFRVLSRPLRFYIVESCRLIDTRNPAGPLGGPSLAAGSDRIFALAGAWSNPSTAGSVAANVAVTSSCRRRAPETQRRGNSINHDLHHQQRMRLQGETFSGRQVRRISNPAERF
ncbi:MAG: hypothetical protein ACRD3V_22865 [Vicinamibacteria bacterium]